MSEPLSIVAEKDGSLAEGRKESKDCKPAEKRVGAPKVFKKPVMEKHGNKPSETAAQKQSDKPSEITAEKQSDKSSETVAEKQSDKPLETTAEKQSDKPSETTVEEQSDKPSETITAAEQSDKPSETTVEEQSDKPLETATEGQSDKPPGIKKDDVKASLNAIFAKKGSETELKPDLKQAAKKEEKTKAVEEDEKKKGKEEEEEAKKKKEESEAVPQIIVEETTDASDSQGMKAEEKKQTRFAFFKKSKRLTTDEPSDAGTKSEDSSVKSGAGGGFNRRNKVFNPFKSVRKAVNRYRSTRRPAEDVVPASAPPPTIVEPEPIDIAKLDELKTEVNVVEDIRKHRPRGPQGRKRKSMRPSSTACGSESGTPVSAALEDLLQGEAGGADSAAHSENGVVVDGHTLSVATRTKSLNRPSSTTEPPISEENHPPPDSDLARSDVANLASSAASDNPVEVTKRDETEEGDLKDITVNGGFCTSALGDDSNVVGETF